MWSSDNKTLKTETLSNVHCIFPADVLLTLSYDELRTYERARTFRGHECLINSAVRTKDTRELLDIISDEETRQGIYKFMNGHYDGDDIIDYMNKHALWPYASEIVAYAPRISYDLQSLRVEDAMQDLNVFKYMLDLHPDMLTVMKSTRASPEVFLYMVDNGLAIDRVIVDVEKVLAVSMKDAEIVSYMLETYKNESVQAIKKMKYKSVSAGVFTLLVRQDLWSDTMIIKNMSGMSQDTIMYMKKLMPTLSPKAASDLVFNSGTVVPEYEMSLGSYVTSNQMSMFDSSSISKMLNKSHADRALEHVLRNSVIDDTLALQDAARMGDIKWYERVLNMARTEDMIIIDSVVKPEFYRDLARIIDKALHYISPELLVQISRDAPDLFRRYVVTTPFINDVRYCTCLPLHEYHLISSLLRNNALMDYGLLVPVMSMYDLPQHKKNGDTVNYLLSNLSQQHLPIMN